MEIITENDVQAWKYENKACWVQTSFEFYDTWGRESNCDLDLISYVVRPPPLIIFDQKEYV